MTEENTTSLAEEIVHDLQTIGSAAAHLVGLAGAPTPESVAAQAAEGGKPFAVTVEGAENSQEQVTSIQMQPEDPADQQRADEARARVEEARLSQKTLDEMAAGKRQIGGGDGSTEARRLAEMEAGRQRLLERQGLQALVDAKRSSEASEGARVTSATEANKDL